MDGRVSEPSLFCGFSVLATGRDSRTCRRSLLGYKSYLLMVVCMFRCVNDVNGVINQNTHVYIVLGSAAV